MCRKIDIPVIAFVGIGSNLPGSSSLSRVVGCIDWLRQQFGTVNAPDPYFTPGVGEKCVGMTYCNTVAKFTSTLSSDSLQALLKRYEDSQGRVHGTPEVVIDCDLVIYDNHIIRPRDFTRDYFQRAYRLLT